MSIDFTQVKSLVIPEGKVKKLSIGGVDIWTPWDGILYDSGDEYLDITHGWSLTSGSDGYVDKSQTGKMVLTLQGNGRYAFIQTGQMTEDISKYKYVNVRCYITGSSASSMVMNVGNNNTSIATFTVPVRNTAVDKKSSKINNLGNYSVLQIGQVSTNKISRCNLNIEKIWLSVT